MIATRLTRPTLQQFIDHAKERYNCTLDRMTIVGPRGPTELAWLVRPLDDGDEAFALLPDVPADQPIEWEVLQGLADQLQLPAEDYGLGTAWPRGEDDTDPRPN